MKHKTILAPILVMATSLLAQAQSVLGPGDSLTWPFQLRYDSTVEVNSPFQSYGGYVMLDYTYVSQAGPLEYRLQFFEDFTSLQPIRSSDVRHLTGLHDQTGMPLIWVPEFSPPQDAWADLDGVLRITILSGQMRGLRPHISMLVATSPGLMDYYQAVVLEQPSLSTRRSPVGLVLTWPAIYGGFVLEATDSFNTGSSWRPVQETPVFQDGSFHVTVNSDAGTRFFRLRKAE